MQNSRQEAINKFNNISKNLFAEVDAILLNMQEMVTSTDQHIVLHVDDIQKIINSTELFKNKLSQLIHENFSSMQQEKISSEEYLANVRHDLRDLINAIQGYTEIALEEFKKEKQNQFKEKLLSVHLNVRNISDLIDQIRLPYTIKDIAPGLDEIPTGTMVPNEKANFILEVDQEEYERFRQSFTILIVDDVEQNCRILKYYLNSMGYQNIHVAQSAFQALSMMEKSKYDLLLLDIDMPGMSGIELLQQIKMDVIKNRILVIMISGGDTIDNAVQCIQLGAEDLIIKPFNMELLRVRVNACFDKKWFLSQEMHYRETLESEKQRYNYLLQAIFSPVIADELLTSGYVNTKSYPRVAVLFLSVIQFPQYCRAHLDEEIINRVQELAEICEIAAFKHNLQKIKSNGSGFLAIAGMFTHNDNSVLDCIHAVQEIFTRNHASKSGWQLHAGIHFGDVIGGILGHQQFLFDVWNDTVSNTDSIRKEARAGSVFLSSHAAEQVKNLVPMTEIGKFNVNGLNIDLFEYIVIPEKEDNK